MEDQQLASAVQKIFLARTRRGRILKTTLFWITLFVMFVIPLGPIVLYFMWKHGDRVAAENAAALAAATQEQDRESTREDANAASSEAVGQP
jgi:hypothetical protein